MPTMPRPRTKATKIAYSLKGIPSNIKGEKARTYTSGPQYGFTYGNKLVGTILR